MVLLDTFGGRSCSGDQNDRNIFPGSMHPNLAVTPSCLLSHDWFSDLVRLELDGPSCKFIRFGDHWGGSKANFPPPAHSTSDQHVSASPFILIEITVTQSVAAYSYSLEILFSTSSMTNLREFRSRQRRSDHHPKWGRRTVLQDVLSYPLLSSVVEILPPN